jgi:Zn-finger nucleic acid-binding protein
VTRPAYDSVLDEIGHQGVENDRSPRRTGVWLDRSEFDALFARSA